MMKRLGIILVAIVVLIAASELLLPRLVGDMVSRGMANATGTEQVVATVAKRPAVLMLGGSFDSVNINAANAKIDKLTFNELTATLKNVELDMGELLSHRQVMVKTVRDVDLTAMITQDELSRYLNQSVKGVKNATVTVGGDKVQISTNYALGAIASIAITLDGKIVGDGQKLKFVTERFLLNNTMVGNIGGSVLTEIPLVDLKKLPFGVGVRNISMQDGKVTIYADNRTK